MKNYVACLFLLGALVNCSVTEGKDSVETALKNAMGSLYPTTRPTGGHAPIELNKVLEAADLANGPDIKDVSTFKSASFFSTDAPFYALNVTYSPEPTKDLTLDSSYPYTHNVTDIALIDNTKIGSKYAPVKHFSFSPVTSSVPTINNLLTSARAATASSYNANNIGIYSIAGESKKFMFKYLDREIEFNMVKANETDFLAVSTDFSVTLVSELRNKLYRFVIIRPNTVKPTLNSEKFAFSGSAK